MSTQIIYFTFKAIFSVFMLFSAIGELTLAPAVVESMRTLQMPLYWLPLLGVLKIAGVVTIWIKQFSGLKEWAYAGFMIDFLGAIFGYISVGKFIMPDIVLAPLGMILCIITYYLYHQTTQLGSVRRPSLKVI